jgi:hypothetical protein
MTVDHEVLVSQHVQWDTARVDPVQAVLNSSEIKFKKTSHDIQLSVQGGRSQDGAWTDLDDILGDNGLRKT